MESKGVLILNKNKPILGSILWVAHFPKHSSYSQITIPYVKSGSEIQLQQVGNIYIGFFICFLFAHFVLCSYVQDDNAKRELFVAKKNRLPYNPWGNHTL